MRRPRPAGRYMADIKHVVGHPLDYLILIAGLELEARRLARRGDARSGVERMACVERCGERLVSDPRTAE
ncbi:MAG: hypothetical protein M3380_03935 [Chloroflexota bacterium]|nr:hypothetical protein [Chloroflexota bacterium]